MSKKYSIYRHISPSGKSYIGQTGCVPISKRWSANPEKRYEGSRKLYHAIVKYGWDNFVTEILESELTLFQANEKERYYINRYNTVEDGYNLERGGRNSEPTQHMIELARLRKPMLGKNHSSETKEKMRLAATGRTITGETRLKISSTRKLMMTDEYKEILSRKCSGWSHTDEAKKKVGLASLGNKNCLGRVQPEEERKLRSLSARNVLPLPCGHKRHNRYSKCIINLKEIQNENNNDSSGVENQVS